MRSLTFSHEISHWLSLSFSHVNFHLDKASGNSLMREFSRALSLSLSHFPHVNFHLDEASGNALMREFSLALSLIFPCEFSPRQS